MGAFVAPAVTVDGTKIPQNANKTPQQRISEFATKIQTAAKFFAELKTQNWYSPI